MAINNTLKSYSKMEFPLSMQRQDAFSLDASSVWDSLETAQTYAQTDPTAYVGQIIAVVVNGVAEQYQIKNTAGDLSPIGGVTEHDVATEAECEEMLDDVFGTSENG